MGKVVKAIASVALIVAGVVTMNPQLIAMGVGLGLSTLKKRPKSSPANTDRLNASINPNAPRTMVFGHTAMATDIRDQEFTGSDQEYLHRFIVVAAHKVQSIDTIWFDDKVAWTLAGGVQGDFVGYLDVTPITEGSSANAINISARMGSARRYTGCAYVYFKYKLTGNSKKAESPFAQSVPTRMTIVGKGALTYDPRLDSTVTGGSGSMRADDQSTWAWDDDSSRNPAIQSLNYLLGWRINDELSVGKGIPANRIDLASFITAANICDEDIDLAAGGTEPRYRFDGIFSEADDLSLVIGQFEQVMDARFHDPQGRVAVKCMVYDHATPVAQFTQHDVLGAIEWNPYGSLDEAYNIVRGKYTDATDASLYQLVDYPEIKVASSDGVDRILTFDMPGVQSAAQAQRLAKRKLKRAQYGGSFVAELQATAWRCAQYDPVRMTFPKLGLSNAIFRVGEIETRVDGVVPVMLEVENADIYEWEGEDIAPIVPVYPTQYDNLNSPAAAALNGIEEGVNVADGVIKAGKVESVSMVGKASYDHDYVFADYAGWRVTPSYGTWTDVDDGTTPMTVSITTADDETQQVVVIDIRAVMKGDGSDADNLAFRVVRDGSTALSQVPTDVQIFNDRRHTVSWKFIDDAPTPGATHTYDFQFKAIASDGWPYWYNLYFDALCLKK